MKIRHVIFDWSGTLYDDHRASFPATRQTIRHFSGKRITYREYKKHFVIPVDKFYRRYDKKTPIADIDQYYFEAFARNAHLGKIFAGVKETLRELKKQKIGVSLLSTVRQDILETQVRRVGLSGFVDFIRGSVFDKTKELKTHLKRLRLSARETLFIGDMAHDVEAANAAKVLSGCVANGYHSLAQLSAAKPRLVWSSQKDWLPFFRKLSEPKPKKMSAPHPVATVGALVLNRKGEALLVLTHKWGYTYGIPGGKIDKGETAKAALIREFKEETGLKIRAGDLFLMMDCIESPEFYVPNSHFLLLNYLARAASSAVKLNDEALSYLWIRPEAALRLKLNEPTRRLISAYLQADKNGFTLREVESRLPSVRS